MKLDPTEFGRLRKALLSTDLPGFARHMSDLQFHAPGAGGDAQALAEELGLVRRGTRELTETGWFVADACREYVFWLERDRRLPFGDHLPDLVAEAIDGHSVLEIGSGSGVNLMSMAMSGRAAEVVGLEPVEAYRQMGAVLAEAEGLGPILVEPGAAERLPFEDARFDTVLCVSAHQYFDVVPALAQIARVLRPGGEVVMISGTLGSFVRGSSGCLLGRNGLSGVKNYVVTVANTLGYMSLGRRVLVRPSKWTTAYPIYPSRASMRRMIARAGLRSADGLPPRVGMETCFRAIKPAG